MPLIHNIIRSEKVQALRFPSVWRRAARVSLWVGGVQIILNQGDHWMRGEISALLIAKTILTPLVTFSVALYAGMEERASVQASQKGEMI